MFAQKKTLFKDLGSDMLLAITCTYISTTCKSIITTTVESLYLLTYVYIFLEIWFFKQTMYYCIDLIVASEIQCLNQQPVKFRHFFYVPSY